MKIRTVYLVVFMLIFVGVSQAAITKWSIEDGGNDNLYEIVAVPGGITWPAANERAIAAGGHLATVTSAAENSFIFSLVDWGIHFHTDVPWGPWLGGYQSAGAVEPYGGWVWVTGEPFVYSNWTGGNPDDWDGIEDYLHFFPDDHWNDVAINGAYNSTGMLSYVVEYEVPEPASVLIFGIGGLLLLRRNNTHCEVVKQSKNGNIRVESEEGKGSKFFVSLPSV